MRFTKAVSLVAAALISAAGMQICYAAHVSKSKVDSGPGPAIEISVDNHVATMDDVQYSLDDKETLSSSIKAKTAAAGQLLPVHIMAGAHTKRADIRLTREAIAQCKVGRITIVKGKQPVIRLRTESMGPAKGANDRLMLLRPIIS